MKADRNKIEIAMAQKCMNHNDIAREAGMPIATVKKVLYGQSVKPYTLGKVAKALGVDVTEIML